MNRLLLAFGLLLGLSVLTYAQENDASGADAIAVRSTVTNYIEAYYDGDAKRMAETLHSHYLKHMIHGDIPMREKTGAQMLAEVRKSGAPGLSASQKTEQVIVLDIAGDMASAKLVTPGWTDYMTLSKVDREWRILSVVQRID